MKPQIRLRRTGNTEQFSGTQKEFHLKDITSRIISCPIEVQSKLGPGLLENISVNSVVNFLTTPFCSRGGSHGSFVMSMCIGGRGNEWTSQGRHPSIVLALDGGLEQ